MYICSLHRLCLRERNALHARHYYFRDKWSVVETNRYTNPSFSIRRSYAVSHINFCISTWRVRKYIAWKIFLIFPLVKRKDSAARVSFPALLFVLLWIFMIVEKSFFSATREGHVSKIKVSARTSSRKPRFHLISLCRDHVK